MQLHQLLNSPFKSFKLKNGKKSYNKIHIDGDRKKIRISRKEKGKEIRRYVEPHTEVEILK